MSMDTCVPVYLKKSVSASNMVIRHGVIEEVVT